MQNKIQAIELCKKGVEKMFEEYIEEQLEDLENMIENHTFNLNRCNNFIQGMDLEDECTHDEISDIQRKFMNRAKSYLSNNYPKQYAMWVDWCVHITTVDLYREIMWGKGKYSESYKELKESREII